MKKVFNFLIPLAVACSIYLSSCNKTDEQLDTNKKRICNIWKPYAYSKQTDTGSYSFQRCVVIEAIGGNKTVTAEWYKTERWTFRQNGTCVISELASTDSGTWTLTNDGDYNTVIMKLIKNTKELKFVTIGDSSLSFEETIANEVYHKSLFQEDKKIISCNGN